MSRIAFRRARLCIVCLLLAIAGMASCRVTTIPPEEIELARLKSRWQRLGQAKEERGQFFDALVGVYNAGEWLSKESIDWSVTVLDQGVKEEHVYEIVLPHDLREGVMTEGEFLALGRRMLSRRLEIYGGVEPFLNRQELALDALEQIAHDNPDTSWLDEFCAARRRLIADFREGRVGEQAAVEAITAVPVEWKLAVELMEEQPQVLYISAVDLKLVVSAGSE